MATRQEVLNCGTVFVNREEDTFPSEEFLPDLNKYVTSDHELTYIILTGGRLEAVYRKNTTWYGFDGLNIRLFLEEWEEKLKEIKGFSKEMINSPDGSFSISREWSGHRFTDQEIRDLFDGKEIEFTFTSQWGNQRIARGKLEYKDMDEGKGPDDKNRTYLRYWGFVARSIRDQENNETINKESNFAEGLYHGQKIKFKNHFKDHKYTEDEINELLEGKAIYVIINDKYGKEGAVRIKLVQYENNYYKAQPDFDVPPLFWFGHEFTLSEIKDLHMGKILEHAQLISSKGNIYHADVRWRDGKLQRKVKDGWK